MTGGWSPTSGPHRFAELTIRQLQAIEAFHVTRRAAEDDPLERSRSREDALDEARRLEALKCEHAALIARTDRRLRDSGGALRSSPPRTAIIAHMQQWFAARAEELLADRGVVTLGHTQIGAEAVGWAIAEQPDLVIVGDALMMLSGEQVVRELRRYCGRRTVIGAQVPHSNRFPPMFDAGANAVHVRTIPPVQIVDELTALLTA